jgi:hypothetical protein
MSLKTLQVDYNKADVTTSARREHASPGAVISITTVGQYFPTVLYHFLHVHLQL